MLIKIEYQFKNRNKINNYTSILAVLLINLGPT